MRTVSRWILPLSAAIALQVSSAPAPARACTIPEPALYPIGLFRATPEVPIPTIASGAPILVKDYGVIGASFQVTNAAGATIPLRTDVLEEIQVDVGWRVLRVQSETPLAPGDYTLQAQYYTSAGASEAKAVAYPFTVSGTAVERSAAEFEFAAHPGTYAHGKEFACQPIMTSCGPQTPAPATTKRKHRVLIAASGIDVPASELGQFLYRLISTDAGTNPDDAQYWFSGEPIDSSTLSVEFRDVREEYCVELQALRVRDRTLESLGKHCVEYSLPTEADPAVFFPCQSDPSEYGRAWCTENQVACAAENPRADERTVATPCQYYAEICAPLIGNRDRRDRLECRMP